MTSGLGRGGRSLVAVMLTSFLSEFDVHVVFFGEAAQVDDGVAHASEGGVDGDAGACCDVFEVALAVVSEDDDATLFGWQHLDEFADVAAGLLPHEALLGVVVVEFEVFDDVVVGTVGDDGHLVAATVVVDDEVVCDAHDPVDEFIFVLIYAVLDGCDYFEEGILENIVSDIFVFHY